MRMRDGTGREEGRFESTGPYTKELSFVCFAPLANATLVKRAPPPSGKGSFFLLPSRNGEVDECCTHPVAETRLERATR